MTPRERESKCKETGETQNTDGDKQINTDSEREEKINKGGRRGAESQDTAGGLEGTRLLGPGEERPRWELPVFPTLTPTHHAVQPFLLWAFGLVGVKNSDYREQLCHYPIRR